MEAGRHAVKTPVKKDMTYPRKATKAGLFGVGERGKHSKFKTKSKKVKINGNKPVTSKYKWI